MVSDKSKITLSEAIRLIPHLNDDHRLDRLAVADIVEQLEKQLEPERALEPEAEVNRA